MINTDQNLFMSPGFVSLGINEHAENDRRIFLPHHTFGVFRCLSNTVLGCRPCLWRRWLAGGSRASKCV